MAGPWAGGCSNVAEADLQRLRFARLGRWLTRLFIFVVFIYYNFAPTDNRPFGLEA